MKNIRLKCITSIRNKSAKIIVRGLFQQFNNFCIKKNLFLRDHEYNNES